MTPPRKTLSPDEEKIRSAFRRAAEISRLKEMIPTQEMPDIIAKQATTRADEKAFNLAVAVSYRRNDEGQAKAFAEAVTDAVKCGDARFFEVVAAGMRHATRKRKDGFTRAAAHAMLALVAKLELETSLGRLPDTLRVTRRAIEIGRAWFRESPIMIAGPGEKSVWSKARKAAGIDYLSSPKRGKANRVSRSG